MTSTTSTEQAYDSRPDTLRHSLRVGNFIVELVTDLLGRVTTHDLTKTEPPEVAHFDRATQKLRTMAYDSPEYQASLADLRPALQHHYQHNRHHPEHWGEAGIAGMTLTDVTEMLCDWRASTERMAPGTGDLARSIEVAKTRFGLGDQLAQILVNTATEAGWITPAGEGTPS